ncbi:olfactory receptor 11L1-like [Xenopus laevis]|uniref:Olfactory receptor n=2 Tax=Xenopus laevis TaxID=8355 RepID=A0A1L8I074_XENLA|nr:olfactory receptor 11L1-like [Xenopus laevis]OCU01735.1 hypothetical protein XELAEV_18007511mg [Xenopus laevis]
MHCINDTRIAEIWIVGLQMNTETAILLFFSILTMYIFILIGNCLIVIMVLSRVQLHSPMYFFLCSLSLCEIIFTSNLIPLLLYTLLNGGAAVYLSSCLGQYYLGASLAVTECFLLAVMSLDRYLAICNPLHYTLVMNLKLCLELNMVSWTTGFASMLTVVILMFQLDFCGPNVVDHYFCDFAPILELSCSNIFVIKTEGTLWTFFITIFPSAFIVGTYVCIILAIFRISSSTKRQKTFSTCSSHLSVVCLFYGSLIILYVIPHQGLSSLNHKCMSLIYTVVTPLLNPIIYSFRNQEIKLVLKKMLTDLKQLLTFKLAFRMT